MIILLDELDIMASCASDFSEDLSSDLYEEWKIIDDLAFKTIVTETGRLNF